MHSNPYFEYKYNLIMKVLQVLTLTGAGGKYGGPERVAFESAKVLIHSGHSVQIFSGSIDEVSVKAHSTFLRSTVKVRPLVRSLSISSLWSWKLLWKIPKITRDSDIVHIHLGRELIPIFTGLVCLVMRKTYVTQTHGMISFDPRLLAKLIDYLFVRTLLVKAKNNLVLTNKELQDLQNQGFKLNPFLMPNFIAASMLEPNERKDSELKIVFISRLHSRKQPLMFLELARSVANMHTDFSFSFFGADAGELDKIESELNKDSSLKRCLSYGGSLEPSQVLEILVNADLLVLPSKNEPFPMIILESLSVGTPVLVFPSCGISQLLATNYPNFIAATEDQLALNQAFQDLVTKGLRNFDRNEIKVFCELHFGASHYLSLLEKAYKRASI